MNSSATQTLFVVVVEMVMAVVLLLVWPYTIYWLSLSLGPRFGLPLGDVYYSVLILSNLILYVRTMYVCMIFFGSSNKKKADDMASVMASAVGWGPHGIGLLT